MANQPQTFSIKFDASGPIELFRNRLPSQLGPALKIGAGRAAYQLQEIMRDELDRMIYSTPEPPNYHRTWTLRRATYAARPGANHSRDHDAAFAGVDLGVDASTAGGVVKLTGYEAEIDVGSWANYAWHVHEGHGLGYRVPRPFTAKAIQEAPDIVSKEVGQALAASLQRIVR